MFKFCSFRYIALLAVSIGCYLAAFVFSGILFIWFNPSGHDCGLNVFFIVMTMVLAFSFGIIALHPAVRISLFFYLLLLLDQLTCCKQLEFIRQIYMY